MNDIILSTQNGEPVASSREVAKRFGKNHRDVLRAIEDILEGGAQNCADPQRYHSAKLRCAPER